MGLTMRVVSVTRECDGVNATAIDLDEMAAAERDRMVLQYFMVEIVIGCEAGGDSSSMRHHVIYLYESSSILTKGTWAQLQQPRVTASARSTGYSVHPCTRSISDRIQEGSRITP